MRPMRHVWSERIVIWCLLMAVFGMVNAPQAAAEWYVAGYGGVSLNGRISNGDMPIYGQQQAQAMFPNPNPRPSDYLTQSLRITDDIKLKNSPMFGGRVGYYFNEFGFRWAGVEVEAFTTQPNIKAQTIPYSQSILSNRTTSPPFPPVQPESAQINSTLSLGEARLRVTTLAVNAVIRYPGKLFQPYAGVGVGVFYFQGSTPFNGTDLQPGLNTFGGLKFFLTEKISLFGEYKYNRATIQRLDDVYGLKGNYSISHIAGGIAYHF